MIIKLYLVSYKPMRFQEPRSLPDLHSQTTAKAVGLFRKVSAAAWLESRLNICFEPHLFLFRPINNPHTNTGKGHGQDHPHQRQRTDLNNDTR